jgi:hypothetical protein
LIFMKSICSLFYSIAMIRGFHKIKVRDYGHQIMALIYAEYPQSYLWTEMMRPVDTHTVTSGTCQQS